MGLPSDPRWLVAHYAQLRARHGAVLQEPLLVEPTGQFFPDPFAMEGEALLRLFRRVMSYAPLRDGLRVELAVADDAEAGGCGKSACGTGSCGPGSKAEAPPNEAAALAASGAIVELEEGYGVVLRPDDLRHPTLLTSALARAAGALVLAEAGEEVAPAEAGPFAEVAAAASGLGLLLLGGASVYAKSCGGMRESRNTYLAVEDHALLVALFCRVHGYGPGRARKHLETTQREAFGESLAWVDSNPSLVASLRDAPSALTDGAFALEPTKGLLARLFGRRSAAAPELPALAPKAPKLRSAEEQRRLLEARALVEEALGEGDA